MNSSRLRSLGYAIAIALVAAAVWFAVRDQQPGSWAVLAHADPWLIAALIAVIIVANLFVPGLQFWLVTRPFVTGPPLRMLQMQALIAGSALLNYTPFRAGLFGRIAYLRHFHGVGYGAALLTHAIIAVLFLLCCALALLLTFWRSPDDPWWWAALLGGIAVLPGAGVPALRRLMRSGVPVNERFRDSPARLFGLLAASVAAQAAGILGTALRWWLVFNAFERPVGFRDACLASVMHLLAIIFGPANGLGLREWMLGLSSRFGLFSGELSGDLVFGVTAALADRGVEAVVMIVFGIASLVHLRHAFAPLRAAPVEAPADYPRQR